MFETSDGDDHPRLPPLVVEDDDARLLARALGIEDEVYTERLRARLAVVGGIYGLWNAGTEALEGLVDVDRALQLEAILRMAGKLIEPPQMSAKIEGAAEVAAYFRPRLARAAAESFWVLMLDGRGYAIGTCRVALGTLTACIVHPREVFAPAIRARAASIIVVHNHPSGDPEPSREDDELTERLTEAGSVLGIPVLDHVVVAKNGYRSLSCVHVPFTASRRRREVV